MIIQSIKKHYNKFDRLTQVISSAISSADKLLKHMNLSSFQTQFAYKIYLSDRENIMNEFNNFSFFEISNNSNKSTKNSQKQSKFLKQKKKVGHPNNQYIQSIQYDIIDIYERQSLQKNQQFHKKSKQAESQISRLSSIINKVLQNLQSQISIQSPIFKIIDQTRKQFSTYQHNKENAAQKNQENVTTKSFYINCRSNFSYEPSYYNRSNNIEAELKASRIRRGHIQAEIAREIKLRGYRIEPYITVNDKAQKQKNQPIFRFKGQEKR